MSKWLSERKTNKNSKILGLLHRYRKKKIDCLRFAMWPLLGPGFQGLFVLFFFDVAVNSTNEANKAGGMRH